MAYCPELDTPNGANLIIWTPREEILLVRHAYGSGNWALPGGALQKGESAIKAAIRETTEETGLLVNGTMKMVALLAQKTRITGTLTDSLLSLYSTPFYSGEITKDETGEISEVQFTPLREIFLGPVPVGLGYKRMVAIWRRQMYTLNVYEGSLSEKVSIYLDGEVLWV